VIDSNYKSFHEYASPKFDEAFRKVNPEVYDLFKASGELD